MTLLLASAVTAAYGWSYDQIVLLPTIVVLADRLRSHATTRLAAILAAAVVSQLFLVAQNLYGIGEFYYVWHPFALTGLYVSGTRVDQVQATGEVC